MATERSIIDAIADPQVFGPWFKTLGTWRAWLAFLRALFGLAIPESDREVYTRCTGRAETPRKPFNEAWLVVGRRGGKSFIVAVLGVFLACFKDWTPYLQRGEQGLVMILAADRRQAQTIFKYARALVVYVPMLRKLLLRETAEALELSNGIAIEVHTNSFRAVRGRTVVCCLCDEIAFWRSEDTVNPDREIIAAVKPGMATIPGALLIGLSSPYSRRGVLWTQYKTYFGKADSDVLVWQADTRTMNPTIPREHIERAYQEDGSNAAAEYGAEFRTDVESFLDAETVESLTRSEPLEIPRLPNAQYVAFVDPSGGRGDAFTLAIGHLDTGSKDYGDRHVVDVVRAKLPPCDPYQATFEYAKLLNEYGVREVTGDRYAASWVSTAFEDRGIRYRPAPLSKSDIYVSSLASFSRGVVELPPDMRLRAELVNLERRTSRIGRDTVDHPPRGHDDLANAACGVLWMLAGPSREPVILNREMLGI